MRERKVSYQVFGRGQDTGLTLTAPSLQRLFIDSALCMSDYRLSADLIKDTQKETLRVQGDNLEGLLVQWLNATIELFATKKFLPYRIVFNQFDGKRIDALLTGETYDPPRHGFARPFQEVLTPVEIAEAADAPGQFKLTLFLKT